jgi:transposase
MDPQARLAFHQRDSGPIMAGLALLSHGDDAVGVVMEATGCYSQELGRWLQRDMPGSRVAIVNPFLVKAFGRSLALRNKTNRLDACMLARYGQERAPEAWVPMTPERAELKDLIRTRAKLVRLQVTLHLRLGAALGRTGSPAGKAQQKVLKVLQSQVEALDKAIEQQLHCVSELGHAVELLTTIPGVGKVTAATMLGEAGGLRAYRRGRQLTAFVGVSLRRCDSGSSVRGRTRMCRFGGAHARTVLYMVAVSASRTAAPLGGFYRRLVDRGKPKKSALGALMRKRVLVMRAVLIQDKPYSHQPVCLPAIPAIPAIPAQRSQTARWPLPCPCDHLPRRKSVSLLRFNPPNG